MIKEKYVFKKEKINISVLLTRSVSLLRMINVSGHYVKIMIKGVSKDIVNKMARNGLQIKNLFPSKSKPGDQNDQASGDTGFSC